MAYISVSKRGTASKQQQQQ